MVVQAYVIDAVRTPIGRRNGGLAHAHPAGLAAHPIRALMGRAGVNPDVVDDVILGCLDQIGSQAGNIARTAALTAGLPDHVPGVTIDRQCGSSQQAIHFASQAVMSGMMDVVVAGGVQNMSTYPIMASIAAGETYGRPDPWSSAPGWDERFGTEPVSQFFGADHVAERWGLSRDELERYALESHERAIDSQRAGRFAREIVPFEGVAADEGPRPETTIAKMAALRPVREGGTNTPATSSQISDGAAAVLIASEQAVREHGLTPRARVHAMTVRGDDPVAMLTAPMSATRHALDRAGMRIDDIDVFEVNEAFASVPLAWMRELEVDPRKVNLRGGAIAIGHPLGASGARIFATMLNRMEDEQAQFGLQVMCEAGGIANVTIIERV